MRRLGIALSLVFTGCPEASDPNHPELIVDSGLDGSKPVDEMDAKVVLDADTSDAQVDAAVCNAPELVGTCSPSPGVQVRCGSLVCSGSTPVCCEHNVNDNIAATCVGLDHSCAGSTDLTHNITSDCDNSDDCQPGFVCVDGYNKGLNQRNGARCVALQEVYCRRPPVVGTGITQEAQLCHADCECPRGQTCNVLGTGAGRCMLP